MIIFSEFCLAIIHSFLTEHNVIPGPNLGGIVLYMETVAENCSGRFIKYHSSQRYLAATTVVC